MLINFSFTDPKEASKPTRQRLEAVGKRQPGEYELFGTFAFLLRCTADLKALGYPAPVRNPSPPQEDISNLFEEDPEKEEETPQDPEPKKTKSTGSQKANKVKDDKTTVPQDSLKRQRKKAKDGQHSQSTKSSILKHLESSRRDKLEPNGEVPVTSDTNIVASKSGGIERIANDELLEHSDNLENTLVNESLLCSDATPAAVSTAPLDREFSSASQQESHATHQALSTTTKPLILAGMLGGPAHLAFEDRDSTHASDSRPPSPSHDGLDQLISDQLYNEASQAISSGPHDEPEGEISQKNLSSNLSRTRRALSLDQIESPNFEPLTPPCSAKKPHENFDAVQMLRERRASMRGHTDEIPSSFPESARQFPVRVTSNCPPSLDNTASELSDVSTEIADPEEIEAAVRNSQRTSIESPILGSRSFSSSFKVHAQSPLDPHIPAQQVRMHWQNPSPPFSFVSPSSPKVPEQVVCRPSSANGDQNGARLILPDPSLAPKLVENPNPMDPALKRKADVINSQENNEQGPRKTTVAPALRTTDELKRRREAAQARLAAAKQREAKIQQKKLEIEEIERENNEVC
jgi:hypothetical protein